MKKAIFLDRDGTIIFDKNYLSRVEDIEYFPDTFKALKILQDLGYEIFLVTNQSGVGRGYFNLEAVHQIHKQIQNELRNHHLQPIKDFAICPHAPDEGCDCRKPSGKMITELMKKNGIKSKECYMLGDKLDDAKAGLAAGIHGVIIRASSDQKEFPFFKTLLDFALDLKQKIA